jgi:site-specific DNA-cytosine methylase
VPPAGDGAAYPVRGTITSRSADRGGPGGDGIAKDLCYTLNASEEHAVAYETMGEVAGTLSANRGGTERPAGNANELDFVIACRETASPVTASAGHHGHSSPRGDGSDKIVATVAFDWQKGNDVTNPRPSTLNVAEEESPTLGATRTPAVGFDATFGRNSNTFDEATPPVKVGTGLDIASPPAAMTPAMQVRRLMPVECERLQAWPDGHTEWGIDEEGNVVPMSDSARYRQAGNGVTATVAAWLAAGCREVLE